MQQQEYILAVYIYIAIVVIVLIVVCTAFGLFCGLSMTRTSLH